MTEKSHPGLIGSDLARRTDNRMQEIEDSPLTHAARAHRKELAEWGREYELMVFSSSSARVFIYCGEFVAECPREGCGGVEFMTDKEQRDRGDALVWGERRTVFHCAECNLFTDKIKWSEDADELMKVLNRRPIPHTRNWFPEGHMIAVKGRAPHGQTVDDLLQENHEHGVF